MTSIIHHNNPHIVKMDRRYRLYPQGFRYRVEFNTYGEGNWQRWANVIAWCERTWGKEHEWRHPGAAIWNHNYRTHWPENHNYRFLFLRSEEDLTMMLLAMGE
jgi:hypothetical protein